MELAADTITLSRSGLLKEMRMPKLASRLRQALWSLPFAALALSWLTIQASCEPEDPIALSRVLFVTSPKWYVLKQMAFEDDILIFRRYAISVIDGKLAEVEKTKNIFDFGCQRTNQYSNYLVFHFSEWVALGLSRGDWVPKMGLHIALDSPSFTFDVEGEFKNGSLFIDLSTVDQMT